jgi:hypothetical protein
MSATITIAHVGDLIKKGYISERAIESGRAAGLKPSQVLADWVDEVVHDVTVFHRILAPRAEYEDLAYNLPEFTDAPIFHLAWQQLGRPTEFLVTCMDDGDEIFIDTQGYDYARYRGGVMDTEEVPVDSCA